MAVISVKLCPAGAAVSVLFDPGEVHLSVIGCRPIVGG